MLVNEIFINEASMSDLADLQSALKNLSTASVDYDIAAQKLYISWKDSGLPAVAILQYKNATNSRGFFARLYAAAASTAKRKITNWKDAQEILKQPIRKHALQFLIDDNHWRLIGGRWQGQRL